MIHDIQSHFVASNLKSFQCPETIRELAIFFPQKYSLSICKFVYFFVSPCFIDEKLIKMLKSNITIYDCNILNDDVLKNI